MKHLKAGRVCSIRVNPKDCMSVADAVQKLGLDPRIMTFDQAVRVTLSSALESLRRAGTLPERDGFEYTELMDRFKTKPSDMKGKLAFTELVNSTEYVRPLVSGNADRAKRLARYTEMKLKFDADPLNHPKPQPGTTEWQEWEALCAEFFEEQP